MLKRILMGAGMAYLTNRALGRRGAATYPRPAGGGLFGRGWGRGGW